MMNQQLPQNPELFSQSGGRGIFLLCAFGAAALALILPATVGILFSPELALPVLLTWAVVVLASVLLRSFLLFFQDRAALRWVRILRTGLSGKFWNTWRSGIRHGLPLPGKSLEQSLREICTLENRAEIARTQSIALLAGGLVLLLIAQPLLAFSTVVLTGICVPAWMFLIRKHHEVVQSVVSGKQRAEELVRCIATLRSLGCEQFAFQNWRELIRAENTQQHRGWLRLRLEQLLPASVGYLVTFGVFLLAEPLRADNVPTIFSFAAALCVFITGIDLLTDSFRFRQMSTRLRNDLGLGKTHHNKPSSASRPTYSLISWKPRGGIRLQNLTFGYVKNRPPLLHNLSRQIEPGEQIILTGPPGSGKSTLLRLLIGMERPWSGDVFFDGRNLKNLDASSLRRHIGFVGQDTPLVPGSLLSNIDPAGTFALHRVWMALQQACLNEEVMRLPLGLSSVVTGNNFPAGFRQRIALARAFLREPCILFLDEATSSVDRRCQAEILGHLRQMHCTVLMVSQRVSSFSGLEALWALDSRIFSPTKP